MRRFHDVLNCQIERGDGGGGDRAIFSDGIERSIDVLVNELSRSEEQRKVELSSEFTVPVKQLQSTCTSLQFYVKPDQSSTSKMSQPSPSQPMSSQQSNSAVPVATETAEREDQDFSSQPPRSQAIYDDSSSDDSIAPRVGARARVSTSPHARSYPRCGSPPSKKARTDGRASTSACAGGRASTSRCVDDRALLTQPVGVSGSAMDRKNGDVSTSLVLHRTPPKGQAAAEV